MEHCHLESFLSLNSLNRKGYKMLISFLHQFSGLLRIIFLIATFFVLPLPWILVAIVCHLCVIPLLGALLYTPFYRPFILEPMKRAVLKGALEGVVTLIIWIMFTLFFMVPECFLPSLIVLYAVYLPSQTYTISYRADPHRIVELGSYLVSTITCASVYILIFKVWIS